jgi:hypothetical protein
MKMMANQHQRGACQHHGSLVLPGGEGSADELAVHQSLNRQGSFGALRRFGLE